MTRSLQGENALTGSAYDVVVVGGGINGVGVAQAAAAAGYTVLLLEKNKLAGGTSSRSSKLIHGGLRYLESYELSLVRESLHERALLIKLAPDLVELKHFYIPVFRNTRRRPWLIRIGLSLYAVLAGMHATARFDTIPKSRWDELDGLITTDLDAVFRYWDGQTDDELLTKAVMSSAQSLGAELAMPARFSGGVLHQDGCEVVYEKGGREHTCRAKVIVNAGGPWVTRVLRVITPSQDIRPVELIQGAHILLPGEVKQGIYYVEAPRDGRAVFLMPRANHTLVGTTETRFHGDPDDVDALRTEKTYLCRVVNHYFPRYEASLEKIIEAWAGLRVLPAGPGHAFHRSRETILDVDGTRNNARPRLISIYGGKLTTYRTTALKVLKRIRASLPDRRPVADTRTLPLEPP